MDEDRLAGPDGPGSAPATAARPPSPATRVLGTFAWILGVLGLLLLGGIYYLLDGSRTSAAERWGKALGTVFAAVIIGLLVRWLVVRVRHRGRVRSAWILAVATVAMLVIIGTRPRVVAPESSGTPLDTFLEIGAPYSLAAANADEIEQFRTELTKDASGIFDVRRVLQDGKVIGYFVVADLDTESSPEYRDVMADDWAGGGGGTVADETVVGGKPAVVGTRPSGAAVLWAEPPFRLTAYATDPESAQKIAAAIMAAYR